MERWTRLAAVMVLSACGRINFDERRDAGPLAQTTVDVAATANLWGAGHATPPAPGGSGEGSLPTLIVLPPGRDRVLRLSGSSGAVDFGPGPTTADGLQGPTLNTAVAYGGLVDVTCLRWNALMAVFLDDGEPAAPSPPSLTIDATAASFTNLGLRQFVFVGDGLTGDGTGEPQTFAIPDEATRVYLGYGDATGDGELPGSYDDNTGTITTTISVE
ncbi:MAG: hypothetical protein H0T79_01680 [Deltaproteobacteria bacterium]|nr:hypothetical protein [Deltaproteobacteria bacterium]